MHPPSKISARLRKIADSSARDRDADRILRGLRQTLAMLGGRTASAVVLQGPFKPSDDLDGRDVYEGTVSGLTVDNDEFNQLLAEEAGYSDPEDVAEWLEYPADEHSFHVKVNWYWTPREPSVGWAGGFELDGWELVALDGMELTGEDAAAVHGHVDKAVDRQWDVWAREAEKSAAKDAAEARAEAMAEARSWDY